MTFRVIYDLATGERQEIPLTPQEVAELEAVVPDLPAYAADARWRRENGGFTLNGLQVATDDRSKMMIMGARIKADLDAGFSTEWKMPDGSFVTITAETIIAVSNAVLDHVNTCFALESSVLADIAAGTITTTAEIEDVFFPPAGE